MGFIILGTFVNFIIAKVATWFYRKHTDMYALALIAVVLVCGGCAYTLDRGLHATPMGYEVSEPILLEEIEIVLNEQDETPYLIASDEKIYFFMEKSSEFANPGEKVYTLKEVAADTVTIIETMEDTSKYQVYEREYKGIPSFWSFAMKKYTEQETVIRVPANSILMKNTVH